MAIELLSATMTPSSSHPPLVLLLVFLIPLLPAAEDVVLHLAEFLEHMVDALKIDYPIFCQVALKISIIKWIIIIK